MNETFRILIVDDSTSFRKGMRSLLEIQPDLQVAGEASSGSKAIDLVEELQPDLILLDAQMPGMTGPEAAVQIKKSWPKVKIILMTMFADYRPKAIDAGVDAFLTKGIPPEQLLTIIRGICQQKEESK